MITRALVAAAAFVVSGCGGSYHFPGASQSVEMTFWDDVRRGVIREHERRLSGPVTRADLETRVRAYEPRPAPAPPSLGGLSAPERPPHAIGDIIRLNRFTRAWVHGGGLTEYLTLNAGDAVRVTGYLPGGAGIIAETPQRVRIKLHKSQI